MSRNLKLSLVFYALLLTMCKSYASEPTTYTNGLSCKNYIDHRFFEWRGEEYNYYLREEGAECSYTCFDGTVGQITISGTVSSLYAAPEAELDSQFCGVALQPTPTQSPPTPTPTLSPPPTAQASPTIEITPTAPPPVLTGRVTMCDTGVDLISFRTVQPPPDLTDRALEVRIAEQESACYVNPVNPSLMTCTIPAGVTFPASVVVSLDGAVVNDFIFDGLGCAQITTPVATTTP